MSLLAASVLKVTHSALRYALAGDSHGVAAAFTLVLVEGPEAVDLCATGLASLAVRSPAHEHHDDGEDTGLAFVAAYLGAYRVGDEARCRQLLDDEINAGPARLESALGALLAETVTAFTAEPAATSR